jgi:Fe-S-cluster containining protein
MIGEKHPSDSSDFRAGTPPWQELASLYEELEAEIGRLRPVCQLSGRCCRFREFDHTLFVSGLEVEYLLQGAAQPIGALDRGETCPWQDARGRCTAREARPLGCRVYFCDPNYESAGPELCERFLTRLKNLTDRHGISWDYAPLHRHLHELHRQGRLAVDLVADDLP